jgi:hypothetical protein|tara:strand:+ start:880 stop:1143 length:264 start_codon:yes stop_codon:yes gene_type:complete
MKLIKRLWKEYLRRTDKLYKKVGFNVYLFISIVGTIVSVVLTMIVQSGLFLFGVPSILIVIITILYYTAISYAIILKFIYEIVVGDK